MLFCFLLEALQLWVYFRSKIHFELNLTCGVRHRPKAFFFFFAHGQLMVPVPFAERRSFHPKLTLHFRQKSVAHICVWVCFWALSPFPMICLVVPTPILHCLYHCSFIMHLKIRWCKASNFVLLQSYFGCSRPFTFPHEF